MRARTCGWILIAAIAACGDNNGGNPGQDLAVSATPDLATGGGNCMPVCMGANVACDPADSKCKPDGTTTHVGASCDTSGGDPKCGTDLIATCNNLAQDGYPGGYCSYEPCSTVKLCPIGSSCAHLAGESAACWKNCATDMDCCRAGEACPSPDYACENIDPLYTSGASHKVCFLKTFVCNSSADCPAIKPTCGGVDVDAGTSGTCQ